MAYTDVVSEGLEKLNLSDIRDQPVAGKLSHGELTKQILLFGLTGDGKSTFGGLLLQGHEHSKDKAVFSTSCDVTSCTQEIKMMTSQWLGDPSNEMITVIDTPGMNDTKCTDEDRLESIILDLQSAKYMNAFVMVVNGMNPRFSESHRQMMAVYQGVFGINFFTNMVIVFNRWAMTDESKERREDEGITQEKRAKQFNRIIRDSFPQDEFGHIPCFFLDSWDYIKKRKGNKEMETTLQNLWLHINRLPVYYTINMSKLQKKVEETYILKESLSAELEKMKEERRKYDEEIRRLEIQKNMIRPKLRMFAVCKVK